MRFRGGTRVVNRVPILLCLVVVLLTVIGAVYLVELVVGVVPLVV